MASIITEQYRKNSAVALKADVNSSKYYIGIGKSDDWYEYLAPGVSSPFPIGSAPDAKNIQRALTDIIKISAFNSAIVIPKINATDSLKYKAYNPYDATSFYQSGDVRPCYFVDEASSNVYLFIYSPNVGLSIGSGNLASIAANAPVIKLASNHIIVKIGSIVTLSQFNNEQFVEIDTTEGTGNCAGYIYGLHVANGGSYKVSDASGAADYSGTLDAVATIYGVDANGNQIPVDEGTTSISTSTYIHCSCTFAGGKITAITLDMNSYLNFIISESFGSTTFADAIVQLTFGNGTTPDAFYESVPATILPMISSVNGFGYQVSDYTPAWYVCFLANTRTAVRDVYSDYAQVSLLKNPKTNAGAAIVADSVSMTKTFTLPTYSFSTDVAGYQIVQKSGSNVTRRIGVVDSYNITSKVVYYNNSAKFGYDPIDTASPIVFVNPTTGDEVATSINPTTLTSPDFTVGSADVLFIDNRASVINRSADQNEELKIIIQL